MNFKKITALLMCLMLILSLGACAKGNGKTEPPAVERADVRFEDMDAGEYDDTLINEIIDRLDEAITKKNNDKEVADLIDQLIAEYGRLSDAYTLAEIAYYTTPDDEELFQKYTDADALCLYVDDDVQVIISRVLDSEYEQIMLEKINVEDASPFYDYEGMSDEEAALQDRIIALQAEFNEYYSETKEVTAEFNGQTITWEYVDSLDTSSAEYAEAYSAMYRAEAMEMGRILIEQAKLRNEVAAMYGYDNYYEMAWEETYSRTYSYEDFETVVDYYKEYLRDYTGILQSMNYLRADYLPMRDCTVTDIYDRLLEGRYLKPNAEKAIKYIKEYNLLNIVGPESYSVGFSTRFVTYNEPYIYVYERDPIYNMEFLGTIAHETGHCTNFFYDQKNSIASLLFDLDVAETQSTGFVLMYMDAFAKIYGDAGKGIPRQMFGDAIGTIQNCGFQAEVERLLYTTDDLTPEKMCELAAEIADEYAYYNANESDGLNYFWAHIPHFSDSPGYVVSYVMSQAASLAMYTNYLDEPKKTAQLFDELLTEDLGRLQYAEMLEKYGLDKIYTEEFYKELAKIAESYRK
ncbi:MAG: hypothetical protein J6S47_06260 [Eubacteriaceae bacterium]|nr:hypothetical protein [Eubacteriaceae bacterium]